VHTCPFNSHLGIADRKALRYNQLSDWGRSVFEEILVATAVLLILLLLRSGRRSRIWFLSIRGLSGYHKRTIRGGWPCPNLSGC